MLTLAKTYNIPCLIRADNALTRLKNQEIVTLDPQKKIVFRGSEDFDPENANFFGNFS